MEEMGTKVNDIGGKMEEIGTKVSNLEAQRQDLAVEAEKVVKTRLDSEEVRPSRQSVDEAVGQAIRGSRGKAKVEAPCFGGSLNLKDLLDWIGYLEKYFEWEEIERSPLSKIHLHETKRT